MRKQTIVLADSDVTKLRRLNESAKRVLTRDRHHVESLEEELDRAEIVPAHEISPDIVKINSQVRIKDLDAGRQLHYTLVFPQDADIADNRLSVLAPLGTAILGYRVGDEIDWEVPGGVRRIKVEDVQHQPRAFRTAA